MSSETIGSTGFYELLAWLEENKKRLAIGFVVAVIVGFAVAAYRWKTQQTEVAASDALLEVRTPLMAGEKPRPPSASAYLKVVGDYPGTEAAERALLLAAGALFAEGKYAEAQTQFSRFLDEQARHPLAADAAYGKAAALEAQGKLDEALAAYQGWLTQFPKAAPADGVKLAIARIYEIKQQPASALKVYEEISGTNSPSATSTEAARRKEHLLGKFPELARTNAPAASVTNANPVAVRPSATAASGATPPPAATNSAPAKP